MAEFSMKIAGRTARVTTLFESTKEYCKPYLTEDAPDFFIETTRAGMDLIQKLRIEEAIAEGIKIRHYQDPYLERGYLQLEFAEELFRRDTLLLHGSTVAVDGRAYLFTADCGVGKSTHTRLWREVFGERAKMVNDDKPFLQILPDEILACGSPWSGKHGLASNICVPLAGICILRRGLENRIRPIGAEQALPMLTKQCHHPLDESRHPRLAQLLQTLAHRTALWEMECNKDPQAAVTAWEAMSRK